MKKVFHINAVEDEKCKSAYIKRILEKLPDWFGNKQALDDYVEKVKECPYWVALNKDNACIGFLSIKAHYPYTGDIFVCGVLPDYQHNGIGKTLILSISLYTFFSRMFELCSIL